MRFPLLLLFIAASCAFVHGDCDRVSTLHTNISEREYVVRLSQNCEDHTTDSPIFCEDSGWGDEEANVVCKSKINTTYGLGDYIGFADTDYQVGYAHVYCKGNEERLEHCEVGNLTSHNCSYLGIARCLDVPQVLVSTNESNENIVSENETAVPQVLISRGKGYQYLEIFENETADFCVIVWGRLSQPLHVLVETTDNGAAVANLDYRPLRQTVTFQPTESFRSQQCLKIELIDDSLAEFWEWFSVTISTNSSTVNLTRSEFNVFIEPNDGECIEGNVTGSTNGRLQLVEMCNSDGVWSPICDNEWTQEDATVVCRELGYQEPKSVRYETINKTMVNATHISCRGNETALRDCVFTEPPVNAACQLALVDCSPDITVVVDPEVDTSDDPNDDDDVDRETETENTRNDNNVITERKNKSGTGSTGGIVSGVVVTLFLVLVFIAAVVVVIICFRWKTKQMAVNTKQVNINQHYESHDMLQDGKKHLDNPVYSFGNDQKAPQPQTDKDPEEHDFANPLYSLAEVEKPQRSTIDIYADDDPEYAVPEKKDTGTQSSSELNNPEPAYAYAENV